MSSVAQSLPEGLLTVVGDTGGAFVGALAERGVNAVGARLHELGRLAEGYLVLVGKAAIDGGRHALANAPEHTRAIVVLPRGAASARIAACSLGARVVDQTETPRLADAVIASLTREPTGELGWTDLGSLLDAVGERVALRLGGGHSRGLQLRVGDAESVAALIDDFARELAGHSSKTQRPPPLGLGVAVAQLSWDDDPQTLQQEDAEVARWRRLSARGASKVIPGLSKDRFATGDWGVVDPHGPSPEVLELERELGRASRSSHVREAFRDALQEKLPSPGRLPSGVLPLTDEDLLAEDLVEEDGDGPTVTQGAPLPLIWRHDPDISETAPREAVIVGGLPPLEASLDLPPLDPPRDLPPEVSDVDSDEMTLIESRMTLPARPEAIQPSEPPPPTAEVGGAHRQSLVAAAPQIEEKAKSRLPLVFGLGLITLSAIAAIGITGLLHFSGGEPESTGALAAVAPGIEGPASAHEGPATGRAAGARGTEVPSAASASAASAASPSAGSPIAAAASADTLAPGPSSLEGAGEARLAEAPVDEDAQMDPVELRAQSDVAVAEGRRAAQQGNWDAAHDAFVAALDIYEPNPRAHAELARERIHAGDAEGALSHAERAVVLRRLRSEYFVLLGDAHRLGTDGSAARRAYLRALLLEPNNAAARRALGR